MVVKVDNLGVVQKKDKDLVHLPISRREKMVWDLEADIQ